MEFLNLGFATRKEILADKFLRDVLISFLQAGRDTCAVTLSWCFLVTRLQSPGGGGHL